MQICCHDPAPKTTAAVAKVRRSNIPVAYETFGPFPDETLLTGIDRLLYIFGGPATQPGCRCRSSLTADSDSECSIEISRVKCGDVDDVIQTQGLALIGPRCSCCPKQKVCVLKKCCCPKGRTNNSTPRPRCTCSTGSSIRSMPKVKIIEPPYSNKQSNCDDDTAPLNKYAKLMKRSFSMCSLACRKIKEKLTFQSNENATKWLWTRVQCHPDGCEVYEIFKNSTITTHPLQLQNKRVPMLIFVVMPNGSIMPFETLGIH